jgi:phytoene dehydrogenase-like protein
MGELDGVFRAWGFAKGGNGSVSAAIAAAARAAGAEIRCGSAVERILISWGRARGVVLEGGEEIRAKTVVSGADPRHTFLQLVGEKHLPQAFVESIRRFRFRGASAKVNLALGELPDFTCLPANRINGRIDGRAHLRGAISISPSVAYLERAYDEAKYGEVSREPYMDIVIPSLIDPEMAPPGKHVMSIFVQYAPYHVNGGWSDARREALGDTVVETLSQYAPNLKNAVLHRQVVTPADIERIVGLAEGNIFQGELSLQQMFFLRPVPAWAKYRTPLGGLYQCGAGTHPGGGVMGASGRNAALQILGTG